MLTINKTLAVYKDALRSYNLKKNSFKNSVARYINYYYYTISPFGRGNMFFPFIFPFYIVVYTSECTFFNKRIKPVFLACAS